MSEEKCKIGLKESFSKILRNACPQRTQTSPFWAFRPVGLHIETKKFLKIFPFYFNFSKARIIQWNFTYQKLLKENFREQLVLAFTVRPSSNTPHTRFRFEAKVVCYFKLKVPVWWCRSKNVISAKELLKFLRNGYPGIAWKVLLLSLYLRTSFLKTNSTKLQTFKLSFEIFGGKKH